MKEMKSETKEGPQQFVLEDLTVLNVKEDVADEDGVEGDGDVLREAILSTTATRADRGDPKNAP